MVGTSISCVVPFREIEMLDVAELMFSYLVELRSKNTHV